MLSTEIVKVKLLIPILEDAIKEIQEILPQLDGMVDSSDQVGARAYAENTFIPYEIFEKFHTGLRRSPEEIAMERSARRYSLQTSRIY